MALSIKNIKSLFPIFTHRPDLVYLDNASTSQKPQSVIRTVNDFYERENASVHRGLYELSTEATRKYEGVRKKVSQLLDTDNPLSIAFTKGTTESINLVAQGFVRKQLSPGDNIVISSMEHHANLIPWQQVCKQTGAFLKIIPITAQGELRLKEIESIVDSRTKLVAITHISNVLGTINPISEIIALAHKKQVPVMVDAAQSAGHHPISVKEWDADFVAFSAHKMFGPMGTGVLCSKPEFWPQIDPLLFGGGAIKNVTFEKTDFQDYPYKLEAGTAHVPGVIGLGAAVDFIQSLDLQEASNHTHDLCIYFKQKLLSLGTAELLGSPTNFGSIASFQMEKIHPHDVASFLAQANIAVRAGHHCAQPLLESMGVPATVRVSLAIYNTREDVDKTIEALMSLKKFWLR